MFYLEEMHILLPKRALVPGLVAFLMVVTLLTAGCGRFASTTNGDLERNPDYLTARKAAESGDFRVAVTLYKRVLRTAPEASQAHLELGVLYDQKLNEPIDAIYHYRQFLELEPNSDRRQVVEGYIERAKLTLAAKLPSANAVDPSELTRLQTEKSALMQENAALRSRVAELEHAANTAVGTVGAGVVVTPKWPTRRRPRGGDAGRPRVAVNTPPAVATAALGAKG